PAPGLRPPVLRNSRIVDGDLNQAVGFAPQRPGVLGDEDRGQTGDEPHDCERDSVFRRVLSAIIPSKDQSELCQSIRLCVFATRQVQPTDSLPAAKAGNSFGTCTASSNSRAKAVCNFHTSEVPPEVGVRPCGAARSRG